MSSNTNSNHIFYTPNNILLFLKNYVKQKPLQQISEKETSESFAFLKERPHLSSDGDELQFGHEEIVNTLSKIVKNTPSASFTIGLFGSWGSGKSTIVENLQKKLIVQNIPLIIFDVWKHQNDSLRRTFLKELAEQLKLSFRTPFLPSGYKLSSNVDKQITIVKDNSKIKWTELKKYSAVFSLIILSIFIFGIFPSLLFIKILNIPLDIATWNFTSLMSLVPIAFLLKFLDKFVDRKKEEENFEKFQDPHEFEREFIRLLEHLTVQKIVIAFDNMDRVSEEEAKNVISTIKTFLDPIDKSVLDKKLVFLIPCDITALRRHIKHEPDEFLRKFINASISIPDFYPIELEEVARAKLKETGIEVIYNEELADLITTVYRKNPRQVIQFINTLVANFILLNEKEISGQLGDHFKLDKNILSLCRFLMLRERFPSIIEIISKKRTYAKEYINSGSLGINELDIQRFHSFCHQINYSFEYFHLFLTLKHSKQEQRIPGVTTLLDSLKEGNEETIIDQCDKFDFKEPQLLADFCDIIKEEFEKTNNQYALFRYINSLFVLSQEAALIYKPLTYQIIHKKLIERDLSDYNSFARIKPTLFHSEMSLKYGKTKSSTIFKAWTHMIENNLQDPNSYPLDEQIITDYIEVITSNHNYILKEDQGRTSEIFSKLYAQNFSLVTPLLNNQDCQKHLLDDTFIRSIIYQIDSQNAINPIIVNSSAALNAIDEELFHQEYITAFYQKIYDVLIHEISNNTLQNRISTVNLIFGLAQIIVQKLKSTEDNRSLLENIITQSFTIFDNYPDWPQRISIISFYLELIKAGFVSSNHNSIMNTIHNFIEYSGVAGITELLSNKRYLDVVFVRDSGYYGRIKAISHSNISLAKGIISTIDSDEHRIIYLEDTAAENYELFLSLVEDDETLIDDKTLQILQAGMTNHNYTLEVQHRSYSLVEKINKPIKNESFKDFILNRITIDNRESQVVGYQILQSSPLINDQLRNDLAKALLEGLNTVDHFHEKEFYLLSLAMLYDKLNEEDGDIFINYLFEKLDSALDIDAFTNLLGTLNSLKIDSKKYKEKISNTIKYAEKNGENWLKEILSKLEILE